MKIRIFALAKDLGMDSKELIEYAAEAGVSVKNSALASITPEERDTVLQHLENRKSAGAAPQAAPEAETPVREQSRESSGKVRAIETRAPRRTQAAGGSDVDEAGGGGVLTAERPEDVEPPEMESADGGEDDETPEEQPEQEAAAAAVETEAPVDEAETGEPETDEAEPAAEAESTEEVDVDDDEDQSRVERDAISRADYVPPTGVSESNMREMKPRGTVPGKARRPKTRPTPQLPGIAAAPKPVARKPKPAETKKDELPAQKPDIPLTAAELRGGGESPLRDHLSKNRKRAPDEPKPGGKRSPTDFGEKPADRSRRRTDRRGKRRAGDEEADSQRRSPVRRRSRGGSGPVELKSSAVVEVPITIRSLSEATGRPATILLKSLMDKGEMVMINDVINEETALELALEIGVDLTIKRERDLEEELQAMLDADGPEESLEERPPVVTILGHVDHGKTSLLDRIRSANVADGEAGGITQHIASYQVEHGGKKITFVDTPGHAAFGEMRARGAGVTDVVVLVVAADDGVMPQTVECISHAKAAGVPMVVAMNKIDLPDTNEQRVLQDLAGRDVLPSEWGGDVDVVRTSATTGQGIDDLLETILLTAELHEYRSNPNRPAVGVCLEAFMDEGRGVIAWLIVQNGTLRRGDVVLCGEASGRIRAIYDDRDQEIQEAGPSTPIKVTGLDVVPGAGDHFFVLDDVEVAREVAEERAHRGRAEVLLRRRSPRTIVDILSEARVGVAQDLPLIIKADTPGSLEALRSELEKLEHPEVRVQIVHEGVGGVNESDVSLASASGAIIVAFHVIPEDRAAEQAEREGVEIRRYRIIYELTNEIKRALEGMLEPEQVEVTTGRALVLQTFKVSRFGTIAGCRVLNGSIDRNNRVHVIRDQTVINDYNIASLKREKDDAKEVREGMECGIRLDGFNDVKEGDLLEAFRVDKIKRTFD